MAISSLHIKPRQARLQSVSGETYDGCETSRDGKSTGSTSEGCRGASGCGSSSSSSSCGRGDGGGAVDNWVRSRSRCGSDWGGRGWLGDGARAVRDGQGGGLSDSVSARSVDDGCGGRAIR